MSCGTREEAERRGLFWMALDVITFVITIPVYGQRLETIKIRNISPRVSGITQVGSVGSLRKKQIGKRRKGSRMNTKRRPGQSGA